MIHRKGEDEGFVKSFRRVCAKLVHPQLSQSFRRQTGYIRCQFRRQVNRCRTVSTADNTDSNRLPFRCLFNFFVFRPVFHLLSEIRLTSVKNIDSVSKIQNLSFRKCECIC